MDTISTMPYPTNSLPPKDRITVYLQPIGSSESRRPFTANYSPSPIVSGRTLVQSPTPRIRPSRIPLAWQVQRISKAPLTGISTISYATRLCQFGFTMGSLSSRHNPLTCFFHRRVSKGARNLDVNAGVGPSQRLSCAGSSIHPEEAAWIVGWGWISAFVGPSIHSDEASGHSRVNGSCGDGPAPAQTSISAARSCPRSGSPQGQAAFLSTTLNSYCLPRSPSHQHWSDASDGCRLEG